MSENALAKVTNLNQFGVLLFIDLRLKEKMLGQVYGEFNLAAGSGAFPFANNDGFEKTLNYGKSSRKRVLISIIYKLRFLIFGLFARPSIIDLNLRVI
jgi:hypothetical protein